MQSSKKISALSRIQSITRGIDTADGNGVKLTRIIGARELPQLDPFLLFDAFSSDKAEDYIGGFPPHPHRGFETVTYMLQGKMRHQDSAGNQGVIETGGVQWMTAGRGIIHSEMPEQTEGKLAGFQLWVNLPASHKMMEPAYQETLSNQIPLEHRGDQLTIKVIAGTTQNNTQGVIQNAFVDPIYWHISTKGKTIFSEPIPHQYNAFVYVIEGEVSVGMENKMITQGQLALLDLGETTKISSEMASQFLLIAAKPLKEPVKRAGPFVMNTETQLQQAFADYQSGQFG